MSSKTSKNFYTQLEGLRGVAVFLVLISHFIIIKFTGIKFLNFGFLGVNLFFVLSGFLITEILLKDVIKGKSLGEILKGFYVKRTLRIFPIYYLSIFILSFFYIEGYKSDAPWAYTYTLNIKDIWFGNPAEIMSHLWSLCVEEQFYIIWPILIITLPLFIKRSFIISVIFISILLRLFSTGFQTAEFETFNHSSMFTCLDALGAGALLAHLKVYSPARLLNILKYKWVPPVAIISFFMLNLSLPHLSIPVQVFSRTICALLGFYLVGWGSLNIQTYWASLVNLRPVRYIGKISYGVYLYHWILYILFGEAFSNWWKSLIKGKLDVLYYNAWSVSFLFFVSLTIIVATVSFYVIEKPLLSLKDRIH